MRLARGATKRLDGANTMPRWNMGDRPKRATPFARPIDARAGAGLKRETGIWIGLGMSGIIGWSVALPVILGAVLGAWLDQRIPAGGRSWTLGLLFVGSVVGFANGWRWFRGGQKATRDAPEDKDAR